MKIIIDSEIFTSQQRGGISRHFSNLIRSFKSKKHLNSVVHRGLPDASRCLQESSQMPPRALHLTPGEVLELPRKEGWNAVGVLKKKVSIVYEETTHFRGKNRKAGFSQKVSTSLLNTSHS